MVFSSLVFLFIFLPIVLLVYYIIPTKAKNVFLLLSSLIFFAWGGVSYSLILISSLLINYISGVFIYRCPHKSKFYLAMAIVLNLGILITFKYLNFIVANINDLLEFYNMNNETWEFFLIIEPNILLPIGISFYTFQALSYVIDVYRGNTPVQKSFINLSLYVSLFPQLIAGPIVRYHDINLQLKNRKHSISKVSKGAERFIIGLGKKVLVANTVALVVDQIFSFPTDTVSFGIAWLGIVLYAIQIYFDFSGYSDMAIGLGKMFGFRFLENFNYPYISRSIQEFWRRWHISLSTWFRDYLYISLGGNRKGKKRTYLNLIIVFFVTGLWHGASWNFIIWGMIHGVFLLIERVLGKKKLDNVPNVLRHIYVLMVSLFAWVFFRAEDLKTSMVFVKSMIGFSNIRTNWNVVAQFIDTQLLIALIIAILGSIGFIELIMKRINDYLCKANRQTISALLYNMIIIFIFILCVISLAGNTYNPFIYFRF
jgi:alginate O-acetyltransferase complex protein AlgI